MKHILIIFALHTLIVNAQPWVADGICDFTDGVQWNNGGAKGCACTWYSLDGTLNCAFGDCGQNALLECAYDCNGHDGFATDQQARQCDATADPICWFNGAGSAGQLFCEGIDALPIELQSFHGYSADEYNFIEWVTASEFENDFFELHYSIDGKNWVSLCEINGAGITIEPQSYKFMHMTPIVGMNYYRLKQYDFNGESSQSDIITIRRESSGADLFSDIYPNPSSGAFFFNYNGDRFDRAINVKVNNMLGDVLLDGDVTEFNNTQGIQFKTYGLSSGVYYVTITQDDTALVKKIIVN